MTRPVTLATVRNIVILFGLAISTSAVAQPQPLAPPPPVTVAAPAPPRPVCFQLSRDGKAWSRTPEQLCVVAAADNKYKITLQTGLKPVEIAAFTLDLKKRVRCADCNMDVFGVASGASAFHALEIKFDGKRDLKTMIESGTVAIGKTTFHYRNRAQ